MSMKHSQLTTYWSVDDAYLILSLLDELSEVLWATYGPGIIEQQRREHREREARKARQQDNDPPDRGERQLVLNLDWPTDPF